MHYIHRDKNGTMKAKYSNLQGGYILDGVRAATIPDTLSWRVEVDSTLTLFGGQVHIYLWKGDTLTLTQGNM